MLTTKIIGCKISYNLKINNKLRIKNFNALLSIHPNAVYDLTQLYFVALLTHHHIFLCSAAENIRFC